MAGSGPAYGRGTARRCGSPWAVSTGPARRRRRSGTATWTERSAPASAPPAKCSPPEDRRAKSALQNLHVCRSFGALGASGEAVTLVGVQPLRTSLPKTPNYLQRVPHHIARAVGTSAVRSRPQAEMLTSRRRRRADLLTCCKFEGSAEKVYTPYGCRAGREDAGRSKPHRIAQPPPFPAWCRASL